MKCTNCNIEFESKRKDARFCSDNCRVTFSRKKSVVTDNVTFSSPVVTDKFEFTVTYNKKPGDKGYDSEIDAVRKQPRQAIYWYDVPLAALPVIKKGWPKMPEYMNGRQYFLWFKNEFQILEDGTPVIHNPYK